MKPLMRSLAILALVVLASGCAGEGRILYFSPAASGTILQDAAAGIPPGFLPIWTHGSLRLALSPAADKLRELVTPSQTRHGGLVVMRVPHTPENLHEIRANSRALVAFVDNLASKSGMFVLATFGSREDFEELSNLSRRLIMRETRVGESPFGLAMELLGTEDTSLKEPPDALYREDIKLGAVETMLQIPSLENLTESIRHLVALGTRYHTKPSGIQTPGLIRTLATEAAGAGLPALTFEQITHKATNQRTLVARLAGQSSKEIVVVSAHMDSVNPTNLNNAPGADDNASGVAVLLEILRALAASEARFERTVEFHFYAAEEPGLVGSKDLVSKYIAAKKSVRLVMNVDMAGYLKDPTDPTIHLITNDTSADARRSAKDLLHTYLGGQFKEDSLASGTSDHRSWSSAGHHAFFPFESPTDHTPWYHTAHDTLANLTGLDLALGISRLGIAVLAHHAGLVEAREEYASALEASSLSEDIRIAVLTSAASRQTIALATTAALGGAEWCLLKSPTQNGCSSPRHILKSAHTRGNRHFFADTVTTALTNPAWIRVFAYDTDDRLAAIRVARLEKNDGPESD
jgi:hypothetical protein